MELSDREVASAAPRARRHRAGQRLARPAVSAPLANQRAAASVYGAFAQRGPAAAADAGPNASSYGRARGETSRRRQPNAIVRLLRAAIISKFDEEIVRTMAAVKEYAEAQSADRGGDEIRRTM
jgi:hypothetical protein